MDSQNKKSVIVIGGGLSGLTAADQILKAIPNAQVTVIEAMSQVGGRTRSVLLNGTYYDLGAQWIGYPQKYAIELARRAGNQTKDQYHQGTKILQLKNKVNTYKTNIPFNVGIAQLLNLQLAMWQIDRMAAKVPKENPRDCPHAMAWDSMTLHTWIMNNIWFQNVRKLFQLSVRAVIGCETNQVSFLFFLWYVHQNHGLDCLVNVENGLQDKKFVKGTQYLSIYLKKEIQNRKGKVLLNTFVTKVQQVDGIVRVLTRDGQKFQASYLVVAIPPNVVGKIEFQPQLSRERRFICDRYIMGAYSKCVLLYDKPYWRQKGFSGQILTDGFDSPVTMAYDDSRVKENGQIQPGIVVFMAAGMDEQWTGDKKKFEKTVAQKLAQYFKISEMLNPIKTITQVWNEEPSLQGGPTCYCPPGVLTKIENIRGAQGLIHWAGTEMATVSQGYMDGAIESGIRVSKQIIRRMNGTEEERQKIKVPVSSWYSKIVTSTKKWYDWI